jgi:hypothetical protein
MARAVILADPTPSLLSFLNRAKQVGYLAQYPHWMRNNRIDRHDGRVTATPALFAGERDSSLMNAGLTTPQFPRLRAMSG